MRIGKHVELLPPIALLVILAYQGVSRLWELKSNGAIRMDQESRCGSDALIGLDLEWMTLKEEFVRGVRDPEAFSKRLSSFIERHEEIPDEISEEIRFFRDVSDREERRRCVETRRRWFQTRACEWSYAIDCMHFGDKETWGNRWMYQARERECEPECASLGVEVIESVMANGPYDARCLAREVREIEWRHRKISPRLAAEIAALRRRLELEAERSPANP